MVNRPQAQPSNPSCGACGDATTFSEDAEAYVCGDCGLMFDSETLEASYRDPDDPPLCGEPCGNIWHGDPAPNGSRYRCGTCQLPRGHTNGDWFHLTDCELIGVGAPHNPSRVDRSRQVTS